MKQYLLLPLAINVITLTACMQTSRSVTPVPTASTAVSVTPPSVKMANTEAEPTAVNVTPPSVKMANTEAEPTALNVTPPSVKMANTEAQTPPPTNYQIIDEFKQQRFLAPTEQIFKSSRLPSIKVDFNPADMLSVLMSTRKYFEERSGSDPDVQRQGILATQGVTVADIMKTLDFMILTLQEDIQAKRPIRLQDSTFLNANFRVIQWTAFNPTLKKEQRLRMTKYAVFSHPGSRTPTAEFDLALYALKSNPDADRVRSKYTKQDVVKSIYEPGGKEFGTVEPLAYLNREGLESALIEGTVSIEFTDGTSAFFNVDRNNGIPFHKGVPPIEQQRYWYFRQVDNIKGYGRTVDTKISIKPGVTFAGDVLNIGLGRMVVTEDASGGKSGLRMGVIADTGGAFLPNLHQLDFLAGVFDSKAKFNDRIRKLPEYIKAYILVKR
jgi:hypothetical protein